VKVEEVQGGDGEERGKTGRAALQERLQRIKDAVALREPDRVPVTVPLAYFPAKFAGITTRDAFYDLDKWSDAFLRAAVYYQPDRIGLSPNQSGLMMETLGSKQMQWPGHGVPDDSTHQFVEGEYMKADEYDMFLEDTADFMIRRYYPRIYRAMEPLANLPSLTDAMGMMPFHVVATPEFADMCESMLTAARYSMEWMDGVSQLADAVESLGIVAKGGMGGGGAPFDVLSDMLRGMRGTMLDMLRQPDKLLEAIEMISRRQLRRIEEMPPAGDFSLGFIALHRGADGFRSNKQFEKFYWPYLLAAIKALVAKGYTPNVFFEGDYTSRLEFLRDVPKGSIVGLFDSSDMTKVKDILGGHICIAGNMPASLLQTGTAQQVKDYCKWLIDVVGKGGGFMMEPGTSIDKVNPDNLKVMVEFTKEYGVYR
jgi:uroporphyrinogen-III decarboxylase